MSIWPFIRSESIAAGVTETIAGVVPVACPQFIQTRMASDYVSFRRQRTSGIAILSAILAFAFARSVPSGEGALGRDGRGRADQKFATETARLVGYLLPR